MKTSGPRAFDYVFSDRRQDQSDDFLRSTFQRPTSEFGFAQHTALILGGEVIGIGGTRFADQNFGHTMAALRAIASFYAPLAALRVIRRGLKIEAVLKPPTRGTGVIYNLAVRAGHQSKGYGELLIAELIDQIRARGMTKAALDVSVENPRAQALYERLGFEPVALHKGGLTSRFGEVVDHIYMEKPL